MLPEVAEIEAKAREAGQPMLPVIERAGIEYSTWTRWKRGAITPNLATLNRVRLALDLALAERGA